MKVANAHDSGGDPNGPIQTQSGPRCHFQPSAVEIQFPELKLLAVLSVVTNECRQSNWPTIGQITVSLSVHLSSLF